MSASREKKQRQSAGSVSPKATRAQQEAEARKRKTTIYTSIAVVVVALVAALLIWDSGLFQKGQTAVTIGDTEYTVNDVSYYYYQGDRYYYAAYGMLDTSLPDAEQMYDEAEGITYWDFFMEGTVDTLTEVTALYDAAVEAGITEEQVQGDVDASIATWKENAAASGYSYASYLKACFGKYMTVGDFEKILRRAAMADAYSRQLQDGFVYTDDQREANYAENADSLDMYDYSYVHLTSSYTPPVDEEGNAIELTAEEEAELKAEAMAETKAEAESIMAALQEGGNANTLAQEHGASGSSDHDVAKGSALSSQAFAEELFGYTVGQYGIYEVTDTGYYVLALHDRYRDETPTADVRHILIRAESTTDAEGNPEAPTDEAWAAAKERADSVLAEYQGGAQTEERFGELANQYSEDGGSNTNGGLYTGGADGSYVVEFNDWVFDDSRQPGDVEMVRHEGDAGDANSYWGYHIIYYVGENHPEWALTVDNNLLTEDMTAALEELTAGYTATMGEAAEYLGH